MPRCVSEPSKNGDDSVLITDLRKCRNIKDVDRYINRMIFKSKLLEKIKNCKPKKVVEMSKNDTTLER